MGRYTAGWHETSIRVRYAETDKMGIAYNGHYLTWFEVARTEFLRDTGFSYKKTEQKGFYLPLIEADVKYLKPVLYDDVLTLRSCVGERPGLRLKINYEIRRNGELLSTGFTEHVFTDSNMNPSRPSKDILKRIRDLWQKSPLNNRSIT